MAYAQEEDLPSDEAAEEICEQSAPTTLGLLGDFTAMGADSVVFLGAGAPADLVLTIIVTKCWIAPAQPYPSRSRFKFWHGRPVEVRCAADTPAGRACGLGEFIPLLLEADIPALSRKGASEAIGWEPDFVCNVRP